MDLFCPKCYYELEAVNKLTAKWLWDKTQKHTTLKTKFDIISAALKRHGWHIHDCPKVRAGNLTDDKCTCGFDVALDKGK